MALQTSQPRQALSHTPSQVHMVSTRQNVGGLKFPRLIAAYIGLLPGKLFHVVFFLHVTLLQKNGDILGIQAIFKVSHLELNNYRAFSFAKTRDREMLAQGRDRCFLVKYSIAKTNIQRALDMR